MKLIVQWRASVTSTDARNVAWITLSTLPSQLTACGRCPVCTGDRAPFRTPRTAGDTGEVEELRDWKDPSAQTRTGLARVRIRFAETEADEMTVRCLGKLCRPVRTRSGRDSQGPRLLSAAGCGGEDPTRGEDALSGGYDAPP